MSDILDLPFVTDKKAGRFSSKRCFWDVLPTGDYARDCQIGECYAKQIIDYSLSLGVSVINWPILDMDLDNRSGIEIGFLSELSGSALKVARMEVRV